MNKTTSITLITLAWLSGAWPAQAASTVDLGVSGRITPSACEVGLSNGGLYDLGKVASRDLNADQTTPLPIHRLQLTISCEALTLVALEPRDNRLGSGYGVDQPYKFGLGLTHNNQKLGYMTLRLLAIVADGRDMQPIAKTGEATWAPTAILSHHTLTAFHAGSSAPTPIQRLDADVEITPTLAPANTLPLETQVPIDGFMTLTMTYL